MEKSSVEVKLVLRSKIGNSKIWKFNFRHCLGTFWAQGEFWGFFNSKFGVYNWL